MKQRVVIIGGGAAGFFAAITIAETNPDMEVIILEKGERILQKVKVSGGGRCNVTNACFIPSELVAFYPRGKKELLGPFHHFMTGDTMEWFENRGVTLKIEADNRVFPITNSSQTIIDCMVSAAQNAGVDLQLKQVVNKIEPLEGSFKLETNTQEIRADKVLVATGSSPKFWKMLTNLGHTIIEPVPSLFTFKINDKRIKDIPGISVPNAQVKLINTSFESTGPLLITHWGLSGPAVLKLSAFGARFLAEKNYQYNVAVNWLSMPKESVFKRLLLAKKEKAKKGVLLKSIFPDIPKRLWESLTEAAHISKSMNWADLSNMHLNNLAEQLCNSLFNANGKTTFKEEFVTAGGIDLKEINFKHFESKLHKNLFFAGEVLNVDALTGGFNFQNAWTGAYIAGKAIAQN